MVMAKARKAAKAKKRRRSKAAKKDIVQDLVKLQQRAVGRWSRYTTNAAQLTSQGSINPKDWMDHYTTLTRGVIEDVGDFVKLVFPRA
jgi:hypothetical protein